MDERASDVPPRVRVIAALLASYRSRRERDWGMLADWLDSEHCGDCTGEPQTCLRCLAERYLAEARWLAGRLEGASDGR